MIKECLKVVELKVENAIIPLFLRKVTCSAKTHGLNFKNSLIDKESSKNIKISFIYKKLVIIKITIFILYFEKIIKV